ncbi:MAG: Stk1 family PASTA domain-containing Ser/Thr kinase [Actinomycetota bacterium]|nr:Stk1 family PASTA domain-containing Ser/Thr kinase [Actinomycetota bacterium]
MNRSELGDRYRIEARIGAGGMAEVFRGFDPVLNRTVAIKVLNEQYARDASFVDRFRREAQAAARLNHPNIVGIYDHGSDDGTQFIVMEFIEGRTLAEALSAGRRPTPVQSAEVAGHISDALAAAHAQGVIHRDIKPANVMVTRDGTVKVMDFGIARLVSGPETAPQTSAVLGTAAYLSPEQAQGHPVDARTDIYSLGTVLYEMLTGRPPFTGESPVAIAYKQVNEPPVPPSILNGEVSPAMDAVVMRALSKNPANRYQTAKEFGEDLDRVSKGQDVQATPLMPAGSEATQVISRHSSTQVLPPVEAPPGSGRKVWLGILIGVLLVGILIGGGYFLITSLTGNGSPTTTTVLVENVVGKSFDDAKRILEAQGLIVTDPPPQRVDATKAPGTVLAQDPLARKGVERGTTVTLTVAKAPTKVPVPNLSDMTLEQAQAALHAVGLRLGSTTQEPSDTVAKDHVVSQDPGPGSKVTKGSLVDVVLSTGPASFALPDVTCLSYPSAKNKLDQLGLIVVDGGHVLADPLCPQSNKVAATNPEPGAMVHAGDTVTLYTGELVSPTSPTPTP